MSARKIIDRAIRFYRDLKPIDAVPAQASKQRIRGIYRNNETGLIRYFQDGPERGNWTFLKPFNHEQSIFMKEDKNA